MSTPPHHSGFFPPHKYNQDSFTLHRPVRPPPFPPAWQLAQSLRAQSQAQAQTQVQAPERPGHHHLMSPDGLIPRHIEYQHTDNSNPRSQTTATIASEDQPPRYTLNTAAPPPYVPRNKGRKDESWYQDQGRLFVDPFSCRVDIEHEALLDDYDDQDYEEDEDENTYDRNSDIPSAQLDWVVVVLVVLNIIVWAAVFGLWIADLTCGGRAEGDWQAVDRVWD